MKKQALIVHYDVPSVLAIMWQEIDALDAREDAQRRACAADEIARQAWRAGPDAEVAAEKKSRDAWASYCRKCERCSAISDATTALCAAINADWRTLYAVAKAFRRRNERDFYRRGTAIENHMTEQNERNFRRLVAGQKTEYVWD